MKRIVKKLWPLTQNQKQDSGCAGCEALSQQVRELEQRVRRLEEENRKLRHKLGLIVSHSSQVLHTAESELSSGWQPAGHFEYLMSRAEIARDVLRLAGVESGSKSLAGLVQIIQGGNYVRK